MDMRRDDFAGRKFPGGNQTSQLRVLCQVRSLLVVIVFMR